MGKIVVAMVALAAVADGGSHKRLKLPLVIILQNNSYYSITTRSTYVFYGLTYKCVCIVFLKNLKELSDIMAVTPTVRPTPRLNTHASPPSLSPSPLPAVQAPEGINNNNYNTVNVSTFWDISS